MNPFAPLPQTPRQRQEIERARPDRVAQHIAIATAATSPGTTLYTAAADGDFLVQSLWVSNITGSAATLGLYVGSVADANAVMKGVSIAANTLLVLCSADGMRIRLQPGVALIAVAGTGGALNLGGWGLQISGGDE